MKASILILLFLYLFTLTYSQIARDVALKFLLTDRNQDNLLDNIQLSTLNITLSTLSSNYHSWLDYLYNIYPNNFWKKYDLDYDNRISFIQLHGIVQVRVKRHKWLNNNNNVMNRMKTQDFMILCDTDKDEQLNEQQLAVCMRGLIDYEYEQYPYKIQSLLFPNRTIGYEFEEFKKLLPRAKSQNQAEEQLKRLFESFEWSERKVKQDDDQLIGPQQGKFLQPTIIYFYLDTNWDQVISKQQAMKFMQKHGGEQAFLIADFTGDGKLDQAEVIAYFLFALCIDEECNSGFENKNVCKNDHNVCGILEGLNYFKTGKEDQQDGDLVIEQKIGNSYEQL